MGELYARLCQHGQEGAYPFHMPGHKRQVQAAAYLAGLSAHLDITEIADFDDLHAPEGILHRAQVRAARLWGSDAAYCLINGSTGGILAAVQAATRRGDAVLLGRNCHKAVYHALELCGLVPVFLQPAWISDFGCACALTVADVEQAFAQRSDIRLLIVTSPSYEGILSDVESLACIAHAHGAALLVDEAHGAHLGRGGDFPASAVSQGADLVVQSLHKTLPCLTQTGLLHVCGNLVPEMQVKRALGIFQSSSPSYLLLASIEGCVSLLEEQGARLLAAWSARLRRFRQAAGALRHLRLLERAREGIFAYDASKLVIGTAHSDITGVALMARLREEFGLELEMATEQYALAMTSPLDEQEAFDRLLAALLEIDAGLQPRQAPCLQAPPLPQRLYAPWEVAQCALRPCALSAAAGCVAAETLWAYPPGCPLLLAGERISAQLVAQLLQMQAAKLSLQTGRGVLREEILVLAQES